MTTDLAKLDEVIAVLEMAIASRTGSRVTIHPTRAKHTLDNVRSLRQSLESAEAKLAGRTCEWTYDDSSDAWDSACGEMWQFTCDGPEENNVRFCHGCGQTVALVRVDGR